MTEKSFTNREILQMLNDQSRDLKAHMDSLITPLTKQVTYTNGKLKRVVFVLTIVSTVVVTLLFTSGSELVDFILKIV